MTRKEIDLEIARRLLEAKLMSLETVTENARTILSIVINEIGMGLVRDGKVKIAGFGTFRMVKLKARMRLNPKTKQRVEEPEHELIRFVPSGKLRERIATNRRRAGIAFRIRSGSGWGF